MKIQGRSYIFVQTLRNLIIYDLAWLSKAINRDNVDNDFNYCEELVDIVFTESNEACTELT
jgi:hypothetical protein